MISTVRLSGTKAPEEDPSDIDFYDDRHKIRRHSRHWQGHEPVLPNYAFERDG
jgi:hypothetical protein